MSNKDAGYIKWRDCIGNLRVWPTGENRRDQNKPVHCKLLVHQEGGDKLENDSPLRHRPCVFEAVQEVWDASFIAPTTWQDVDQGNLETFGRAVKERLASMYAIWYKTFQLAEM